MGLFDTIVKGVGDYLGSDDGDEMIDNFRGFFSDDDGGSDGADDYGDSDSGGGGGLGGLFDSFLGDAGSDEDGDAGEGGWGGTFGRIVDRLSGDGGREDLWDRALGTVADRVSQYLPEELRDVAGRYLGQGQGQGQGGSGGQGSSWSGSLVDPGQTRVPSGWHAVANHPTVGHSYGEGGFGGFLDHSIANLAGNHGGTPYDDGIRYIRAPDIEPGRPLGNDGSPDPRVSMPADALRGARYVDSDGDGYVDQIYPARGLDTNGDGRPDRPLPRPGFDADGDGRPDGYRPATPAGARGGTRYIDTDGDGDADIAVTPGALPRSVRGDGNGTEPDGYSSGLRADDDGDGYPDGTDPIGGANIDRGGALRRGAGNEGYDDRADYDDLVTSGAGPSEPRYQAPDDPTFPADAPDPAAVSGPADVSVDPPAVEAPAGDFEQSIDDANQVDQDMGGMFDGVEGPA